MDSIGTADQIMLGYCGEGIARWYHSNRGAVSFPFLPFKGPTNEVLPVEQSKCLACRRIRKHICPVFGRVIDRVFGKCKRAMHIVVQIEVDLMPTALKVTSDSKRKHNTVAAAESGHSGPRCDPQIIEALRTHI